MIMIQALKLSYCFGAIRILEFSEKTILKLHKNNVKAKLQAQADKANPKSASKVKATKTVETSEKKRGKTSSKIKEVVKETAKTWIPLEERK